MPKNPELLILLALLFGGCPEPPEDPPTAPDPIGEELLHTESVWGLEGCERSVLYREGRSLQFQCFTLEETFSWENRGALSIEGMNALDTELAAADLSDTEPGDYMGLCGSSDANAASMTVQVQGQSVTYGPYCPTRGMESLNEILWTLLGDISDCTELDVLTSVDDGCRAY